VHAQDTAAGQLNEQVVIDGMAPGGDRTGQTRTSATRSRPSHRAKPWPVALCTGGSGRDPTQLTIAGTRPPDQGDLDTKAEATTSSRGREFLGKFPVSEQDREKIAHLNAEKLFTL
jgi:hypothetical protein